MEVRRSSSSWFGFSKPVATSFFFSRLSYYDRQTHTHMFWCVCAMLKRESFSGGVKGRRGGRELGGSLSVAVCFGKRP